MENAEELSTTLAGVEKVSKPKLVTKDAKMTVTQTDTFTEEVAASENRELLVKQRADIKHKPTTAIQAQVLTTNPKKQLTLGCGESAFMWRQTNTPVGHLLEVSDRKIYKNNICF